MGGEMLAAGKAARREAVPGRADRRWRIALIVIAAGTLVRLVVGALLPLVPDEAYYWVWSQRLAAGYFDHPPGIALAIRSGTTLLGTSYLGVRLGPILAGTVCALAIAATARRLGGDGAALLAAMATTLVPLAAAGLVLATPDAPLLATWACAVYALVRALQAPPGSRAALGWWAAAGLALGAAFVSKYTSILLPAGVFIALALHPRLRRRLAEPGPWLAAGIATLVLLPVLIWNAGHGWISFTFQIQHGLHASGADFVRTALRYEGDFLGGQLGLASPILFVLMAIAVGRALRRRGDPVRWTLAVVSVAVMALFAYSALRKRVEPNWPAPAYVGAIILLAAGDRRRYGRWLGAGVVLAGAMTLVVYLDAVAPILPLPAPRDPVARAFGWDALAAAAQRAAREPSPTPGARSWIGAERYQEAAEIAFHTGDPTTFALNLTGRSNQYDLWPGFPQLARPGDRLVLVLDEAHGPPPDVELLAPYFESARRGALVERRRGGGTIATRRIYVLDGWRGGWPDGRGGR